MKKGRRIETKQERELFTQGKNTFGTKREIHKNMHRQERQNIMKAIDALIERHIARQREQHIDRHEEHEQMGSPENMKTTDACMDRERGRHTDRHEDQHMDR